VPRPCVYKRGQNIADIHASGNLKLSWLRTCGFEGKTHWLALSHIGLIGLTSRSPMRARTNTHTHMHAHAHTRTCTHTRTVFDNRY
jgi:hypothetical protein